MLFFIALFALFAFIFTYSAKYIETSQERILILEREQTKLEIDHHFHVIETVLNNVDSYLTTHGETGLLEYLVALDQNSEMISSIYLGKPDKTMINSSGFVPPSGFDLTQRIWYQMATASENIIYTPAFINATNDKVIVTIAKAVYLHDALYGVIATDIDIKTISTIVSEKQIGDTGCALLMDSNQMLIAYPGLRDETIRIDPASTLSEALIELDTEGFSRNFTIQDVSGVIAYTEIARGNYMVAVFMPIEEFTQNMHSFSFVSVIAMGLLFIVSMTLTLVYHLNINKPLKSLVADIKQIDLNRSLDYRLQVSKRLGYKDVREALNNALDTANCFFDSTKEYQYKLLLENQKVTLLMESAADIIFEIDLDRKFRSIFGKGLKKLNMSATDVIGKNVLEVFGTDGSERHQNYQRALNGEHLIYDWTWNKTDPPKYFETSMSPIYDETERIVGAVGITRDITEPMQKQKEIEYISLHDFLTGLYNRRYFVEKFSQVDHDNYYPITLMMLDLNGLKILNDAYGHDIGDEALKKVAGKLAENIVKDIDFVARIGGDEFAIVLVNTSLEQAELLKEKIKADISALTVANIQMSVAAGYAVKVDSTVGLEEMIKLAENQMYRDKVTEGKSNRNNAIEAILRTLTDKYELEKAHSVRVSEFCLQIGQALKLHSDDLKELKMAGLYHDIGKISIPDQILGKPSKLTKEEFEIIKSHTENGYNILRAADQYSNLAEFALSHHERWDGKGYPRGLSGEMIPLFARIISVADAYEAMTSDRPYRKAMSKDDAIKEIIRNSGTQFDPKIARIFVTSVLKVPFKL